MYNTYERIDMLGNLCIFNYTLLENYLMRWKFKALPRWGTYRVVKKFALVPCQTETENVWLEWVYAVQEFVGYRNVGWVTRRYFSTHEEANAQCRMNTDLGGTLPQEDVSERLNDLYEELRQLEEEIADLEETMEEIESLGGIVPDDMDSSLHSLLSKCDDVEKDIDTLEAY